MIGEGEGITTLKICIEAIEAVVEKGTLNGVEIHVCFIERVCVLSSTSSLVGSTIVVYSGVCGLYESHHPTRTQHQSFEYQKKRSM